MSRSVVRKKSRNFFYFFPQKLKTRINEMIATTAKKKREESQLFFRGVIKQTLSPEAYSELAKIRVKLRFLQNRNTSRENNIASKISLLGAPRYRTAKKTKVFILVSASYRIIIITIIIAIVISQTDRCFLWNIYSSFERNDKSWPLCNSFRKVCEKNGCGSLTL